MRNLFDIEIDNQSSWEPSPVFLKYAIATLLVGCLVFMALIYLLVPEQTSRYWGAGMGAALAALAWGLSFAGKSRASLQVLGVGAWVLTTVIAFLQSGMRTPVVMAYPIIIIMVGWLFTARAAVFTGVFTVLAIVLMVVAERAGWFYGRYPTPAAMYGVVQAMLCVMSVFVINFLVRSYKARLMELQTSQAALALAIDSARMMVWEYDFETDELRYDEAHLDWLRVDVKNAPHTLASWLACVHVDDLPAFMESFTKAIQPGAASFDMDYRMLVGPQTTCWHHTRGAVVKRDSTGKALMLAGGTLDITEKKKLDDLIWTHANFDVLTNLPNRRMFHDRLLQELKKVQRSGTKLALFFIDLDRFKEVNDTLGHAKGDALLVEAARRIVACVRDSDTVARMGGDEFTVILTEVTDTASVERVAHNINVALSAPFLLNADVAHVSACVGIALCPRDGSEPEKLLKAADQAMYAAKAAGRNRYSYFQDKKA